MGENSRCVECRKAIEKNANLCVECGSHQDWRRHIKTYTPMLGFVLAFLAFLLSIAPQVWTTLFPSSPKFSAYLSSVSGRGMTFHISNLGDRRIIVDPVLRCVSANAIDEQVVDNEVPFRVWYTTVEGQLERPLAIGEFGGSESATFTISAELDGDWLEEEPVFLSPDDERVKGIEFRFSPGLRHTGFGADRSSRIPTYHIIGKDGFVSLQPVAEITSFCQLTVLDPVTGEEISEGFAVWQIASNIWRGSRAAPLYDVLGTLIYVRGPGGLNETDPKLCGSDSAPSWCITEE